MLRKSRVAEESLLVRETWVMSENLSFLGNRGYFPGIQAFGSHEDPRIIEGTW